jgi:ribulose-phosphate 3-epimerase
MPQPVIIGPSVLSADFLNLGSQLEELEAGGADYVHFDVMDGVFVPNISVGLPVLHAISAGTNLPVDVHLMIVEPDRWVDDFAAAGASAITFHAEATPHMHRVVQAIKATGIDAGVTINPATPLGAIEEILPDVDQILLMTVNPGFGGQSFIEHSIDKIGRLRELIDRVNPQCRLQVDGGINAGNIRRVVDAGATSIVAGSATFASGRSISENIAAMRAALG